MVTEWSLVKAKVDSGACVTVAPSDLFAEYQTFPTYESDHGIGYTSACGSKVPDEGICYPFVKTTEGHLRALGVRKANVTSFLLAVWDMMHKNQRVMFDLDGSYVEHKGTNEKIRIDWDGKSPVIEMIVLDPEPEDRSTTQLCDFGDENPDEPIAQDFQWQAQLL